MDEQSTMTVPINQILHGDVIEKLKELPDECINTVVTSPPYWGLRDYGTADWGGGDDDCDHVESENKHGGQRSDRNQEGYKKFYDDVCEKCGAKRIDKQLGLENTPEEYVARMVEVFREIRRVLRDDGTVWLNLGDTFWGGGWRGSSLNENSGDIQKGHKGTHVGESMTMGKGKHTVFKPKDLCMIPARVAIALQADGWWLRSDIIWHKKNPMPESVTDRPTKSHEHIFLLSKNKKYYYDNEAIKEPVAESTIDRGVVTFGGKKGREYQPDESDPNYRGGNEQWGREFDYKESCKNGRNKRDVWTVSTKPFSEAHFAVYPEELIIPCIKAGCPEDGIVLDPFFGSGTTGLVALKHSRNFIGIELNDEYIKIAQKRLSGYIDQERIEIDEEDGDPFDC